MNSATIGAITIGQSPRDDVVPEVLDVLGRGVQVIQRGAIDELTLEEIQSEAPVPGDSVLVSRMRDGTEVTLRREFVIPRLKQCIHSIEDQVDLILMLCTDPFCGLESKKPLLSPGRIIVKLVSALGFRRIGVVTPVAAQFREQRNKWSPVAHDVFLQAASPYGNGDQIVQAGNALTEKDVELVVMDCIGYTRAMKAEIRRITGRPTVLPATTIARVAAELLG
jgi:protein AroM